MRAHDPDADEDLWAQVIDVQVAWPKRPSTRKCRTASSLSNSKRRSCSTFEPAAAPGTSRSTDDAVVGSCGVIVTDGRGRFEAVEHTLATHRRRGVSSRLVVDAAQHAAEHHGADRFVIVADEHLPRDRSCTSRSGFARAERVFGRLPPAAAVGLRAPARPAHAWHRRADAGRYLGRDGRPGAARPGARAHDRLARLRRERRRAARRLRRLRPPRPAGRHGPRPRDEGAAPARRGDRDRGLVAGPAARRGAVRALPGLRRLPLPGSRLRGAGRGQGSAGSPTRCGGIAGIADPPLEPIVPAASQFHYRNKMEYSFAQRDDGAELGLHRAGRWDEVLEIEHCWLTTDLGNAIRNSDARLGARGAARGVRPGDARGLPAPPRRPRGPQHRPGARPARHARAASASTASG